MIIVNVMGGLGNQMQQYALYQKLISLGKDCRLDISWFTNPKAQENVLAPRTLELRAFRDLPMEICSGSDLKRLKGGEGVLDKLARKLGRSHRFEESKMYHPEIFDMDEMYLEGYFACNKYYADILPKLRELFIFPVSKDPKVAKKNTETLRLMRDPDWYSASVHIRRGDYLDSANADILGGICTPAYYESACRAAEEAAEKARKPLRFFVFSDDPDFARGCTFGTKGEPVTICDWNTGEDSMLDMQLQSACDCNITANSTFSFWGARLNGNEDALKIRPFYHRNNQIPDPEQMHDYWQGFVLIDKDGSQR